jgi:uncharacterized membrane protein YdjX (TVP38/TMEM64 family)
MALVTALLLPGVLFTTGAGFVFGLIQGSICVVIGTTLGATLAFLIARHLMGARARQWVLARARIKLISDEVTPQGWKIVLFSRLVPFFPFKLSNYFFGLTQFSLRGFAGGTLIGVIPFSIQNVYLGAMAADFTSLGARDMTHTPLGWALYLIGFVSIVITVVYLTRLARRALETYAAKSDG